MGLSHTVSGDIASFRTPSRVPIESLKFHFLPKQAAGTPSPENPIPIEGWTGLNGNRYHKNISKPYYTEQEVKNDLTITPTSNGIRVKGTASARTACFLNSADVAMLDSGAKYTFSLYVDGDISECENPFLGYYTAPSVWGGVIGQLTASNSYKITWTVPSGYANATSPHLDAYIYVPSGTSVDFEIGLQMEAGENATAFESYSGEVMPIVFPTSGKNLVNDETTTIRGSMSKSGRTYTSIATDNRGYIELYVQKVDANNNSLGSRQYHGLSIGRNSFTFTVDNPKTCKILFKHNGKSKDMGVYIPWDGRLGTYTISANFESLDITTVGGFIFSDVQIELGDAMTSYEVYSSDNTFYGGYIDPVAGEIVAEYTKKVFNGSEADWAASGDDWNTDNTGFCVPVSDFSHISYWTDRITSNFLKKSDSYTLNKGRFYIANSSWANFRIRMTESMTLQEFKAFLSQNNLEIAYPLATPVHIPIPAQDLKAFLDHNNFWSDANDITEVTYAVTESKDILATRKKAMDFDMGHRRKVKWNQWAPAVTGNKYAPYNSNNVSVSINDGIITQTFLKKASSYGAAVTTPNNMKTHVLNRYYYLSYEYCTDFVGKIGGTVGGQYLSNYVKTTQADVWDRFSGIVKRTEGGNFNNYVVYLGWFDNSTGIEIGSTCQMRNPIAIDLTQMFGEGNEPTTRAEFEKICAINDIDLTVYHPIDTGSDRWLIIP